MVIEDDDEDYKEMATTSFYVPDKTLTIYEMEELRTMRVENKLTQF